MAKKFINKAIGEINVEDVLLDNLAQRKKEDGFTDMKMEVPLKRANFFVLMSLVVVILGIVLFFSFWLQVLNHQRFSALAENNQFLSFSFAAERGIIYDRNKRQLVQNEVNFDLFLNVNQLGDTDGKREIAIQEIAFLLGEKADWVKNEIASSTANEWGRDLVLLKKDLSHQDLIVLETKKNELPYLEVTKRISRRYETDACLGHLLGYLGKISPSEFDALQKENYDITDYIGREGLEKSYEPVLREKKGILQVERTAQGETISNRIVEYPQSGDSITLFLDFELQKKSAEVLSQVLQDIGSIKGIVVALDPRNGGILASVSWPCFDNNLFSRGISVADLEKLNQDKRNPQLNRVISGLYPTGSTVKPVIALAALEEGIVTPDQKLYCPSKICLENQYKKDEAECFPDWTFHGWTDIKRAIAESVNPFFYMIGGGYQAPKTSSKFFDPNLPRKFEGLGVERIDKYLRLFGFGSKAGIDMAGEMAGRVPDPQWKENYFKTAQSKKWYLGDTYNLSIGQGYFLATPLQVVTVFSVIANGGQLLKPQFVYSVTDTKDNKEEQIPPEVLRDNFVSAGNLKIIREGMRQTITSPAGSAFSLNNLPVACAAKTGTAQIYSERDIYDNWIAIFCPYKEPSSAGSSQVVGGDGKKEKQIVMVVLIEEVQGLTGAAQRVAREILGWYFNQVQN